MYVCCGCLVRETLQLNIYSTEGSKFTSDWFIWIVFSHLGVITDYLPVGLMVPSETLPVRWVMRTGTLLTSPRASSSSSAPQTGPWRIRLRPVSAAVTARRRCCRTVLLEREDCPHLRSDHLTPPRTWSQQGCNTKVMLYAVMFLKKRLLVVQMKLSATDTLQNLTGRNISDYLVKTYAQIIGKRWDTPGKYTTVEIQKYCTSTEILHIHSKVVTNSFCLNVSVWRTKSGWTNSGRSFSFFFRFYSVNHEFAQSFTVFHLLDLVLLSAGTEASHWAQGALRSSHRPMRSTTPSNESERSLSYRRLVGSADVKIQLSVTDLRLYILSQQQPIKEEHKLWDSLNDWLLLLLIINSYCESEGLWLTRGQRVGLDLNLLCCLFQGAAADRFLDSLSGFINGLDTKNNVKVRNAEAVRGSINTTQERVNFIYTAQSVHSLCKTPSDLRPSIQSESETNNN